MKKLLSKQVRDCGSARYWPETFQEDELKLFRCDE